MTVTPPPPPEGARPLNVALHVHGPDGGPEWVIRLEHSDGAIYPLYRIALEGDDATGFGVFIASAARALGVRLVQHVEPTPERAS